MILITINISGFRRNINFNLPANLYAVIKIPHYLLNQMYLPTLQPPTLNGNSHILSPFISIT